MTWASFTVAIGGRRLDRRRVDAVRLERRADQLRAGLPQEQQRAVICRLLDDHSVPGGDQVPEEQRRRLHRSVRDHHLLGLDAVKFGDPLAEPGMAAPGAVAERLLPVGLERPGGRLPHRIVGQDVGARGATREADRRSATGASSIRTVRYSIARGMEAADPGGNTVARCRRRSSWSRSRSRPTATVTARSLSHSPIRWSAGTSGPPAPTAIWSGATTRSSGRCAATSTAGSTYRFDLEDIAEVGSGQGRRHLPRARQAEGRAPRSIGASAGSGWSRNRRSSPGRPT